MRANADVRLDAGPEKRGGSKDHHRGSDGPNHIVKAATDRLEDVQREVWNEARRGGQPTAR